MLPSLFISHGSPTLAIEDSEYTTFLKELGSRIKPKAIVVFTAHWESENTTISFRDDVYETIYDFGGFSDELYQIKYPARGSKSTALTVEERLNSKGFKTNRDSNRGLDHGAWVILRLLYPDADIPVVQVSVNPYLQPKEQYRIGEALQELGKEEILVIGSGGISHNLRMIKWGQNTPEEWALHFDDWVIDHVQNKLLEKLFNYEQLAPNAKLSVPRAEHFVPLFIAMGSGQESEKGKLLHRSYQYGTLSHIVFQF